MTLIGPLQTSRSDLIVAALTFLVAFVVFWLSPVHQVSDSDFSMLVSQSLLDHHSFKLDPYFTPRPPTFVHSDYVEVGNYRLELVNDHVYYFFPPGSSVLSLPYVALAKLFGVHPKDGSGTHGEMRIQTTLAALLMATLAVVFFFISRPFLNSVWSLLVVIAGGFGSQVWSTASRGLWSHTWNLLLVSLAIYLIVRAESARDKIRPVLLASLLAWAYFVRPTSSIVIVVIAIYLFLRHRSTIVAFGLTMVGWGVGFAVYSWHNFGKILPSYFAASRLDLSVLKTSLAGNLISPSRGLFVYLPWIFFTCYLLVRYRRQVKSRQLVYLSLVVVAIELIIISAFSNWWGGVSYGPRLTTDLLPWLVLLTVLAVQAMVQARAERRSSSFRVELVAGILLLSFSIVANARGAICQETLRWNNYPKDDRTMETKVWDWKQAQFFAGLVTPAPPASYPVVSDDVLIDVTRNESEPYLWLGWARPEGEFRWTDGNESKVIFGLKEMRDVELAMSAAPMIVPGRVEEQLLKIDLNGRELSSMRLSKPSEEIRVVLPMSVLKAENVLTFHLPNATSPEVLRLNIDQRQLGLAVKWMRFSSVKTK